MALKKPNIVVYLSDDHGWEDLGCYGNKHIQTPHLDGIAEEGIRFTPAPLDVITKPRREA